jgi:hypothetical protein
MLPITDSVTMQDIEVVVTSPGDVTTTWDNKYTFLSFTDVPALSTYKDP